jgi:lysozyme
MFDKLTLLEQQLLDHEGFRPTAYRCTSGRLTLGIGRNIQDKGITEDEALILLRHDIVEIYNGLRHLLPWFNALNDDRQRVLVDLGINLGLTGLMKFKRMLSAMEQNDWVKADYELRHSLWASQVQRSRVEFLSLLMRGNDGINS